MHAVPYSCLYLAAQPRTSLAASAIATECKRWLATTRASVHISYLAEAILQRGQQPPLLARSRLLSIQFAVHNAQRSHLFRRVIRAPHEWR